MPSISNRIMDITDKGQKLGIDEMASLSTINYHVIIENFFEQRTIRIIFDLWASRLNHRRYSSTALVTYC